METVVGVIEKIVYQAEDSDFKVFLLRRRDRSCIRVTGEFPNVIVGAKVEVHGAFKTHPKYGPAFNSTTHTFSYEDNTYSIAMYIQAIAKWIGPVRSMALAKYFGVQLQEIIEKTPERLIEVEDIGEKVATSLVEAWNMNRNMKDIQIFLHGLGLTTLRIRKILSMYGMETEHILRENPWLLCLNGFGFSSCDYIAHKLERPMTDPLRFRFYVLHCLRECLNTGHLFLYPREIVGLFNQFNKKTPYPLKDGEITLVDITSTLDGLKNDGYIVHENDRVYDVSAYFFESESSRILSQVMSSPDTTKLSSVDIEEFISRYEKQRNINLSEAQRDAIRSFVTEKVLIITGSPGVGKTTVVRAFVQLMKEHPTSFELLTPTGISAKRLATSSENEAMTIHRRLGYKGESWDYNSLNKYSTQVVIVDEMSMVDMEVFYRLLSALSARTKLVFVGDYDQLPSVGPGSVLRELIDAKVIKTVFLKTIFRQEECSDIIKAAQKIKNGDTDLSYFKPEKTADIWHIQDKDSDRIEKLIVSFAQKLKDSKKMREENLHFQIITPRNEGPCSVYSLNEALQNALNPPSPDKKEITINKQKIRKGDRILIRKNNYELGVYNGDIGKVSHITNDGVVVDLEDFMSESKRVEIPLKIAEDMIKLAYGISVHKSQGAEYPIIIMPLIKAHGNLLLQRNLLYTAITRAKKKVIIIGQASAIEAAILNDKMQRRNTAFGERITSWKNGTGKRLRDIFSNPDSLQNSKGLDRLLSLEVASDQSSIAQLKTLSEEKSN